MYLFLTMLRLFIVSRLDMQPSSHWKADDKTIIAEANQTFPTVVFSHLNSPNKTQVDLY